MSTSPFNGGSSDRARDRVDRSTPKASNPDKQSNSSSVDTTKPDQKTDISKTDASKIDWKNLDPKTVDWSKATPEQKSRWREQQADNMRVYNDYLSAQRKAQDQADLSKAREWEQSRSLDRVKPDLAKRSAFNRNTDEVDRFSKRVF